MSTLTLLEHPEVDSVLRPVPWQRMAWVNWRQHRVALSGVAVFLGALAVYIGILGRTLHHAYAAPIACHPASSITCTTLVTVFNNTNHALLNGYILQPLPALIGAFLGAPLLAREMESGTFRYAWTQGFGRWRWTITKLVMLAVVVTAIAGAFSVLISWYYQPYFAATAHQSLLISEASPFAASLFDLRGLAFAGWTLVAFAIGALAGMLTRRIVPAIVATLGAYTGLAILAEGVLRRHYLSPLLTTKTVSDNSWIIRQYGTKDARFAFSFTNGHPDFNLVERLCPPPVAQIGKGSPSYVPDCLIRHGYSLWTSYQPVSRFWLLQWIEGGWLLVLSALLIVATAWIVRRRAT